MAVVNKYTHIKTPDDVYIGRGSFWGNPFVIGKDGDSDDVVRKYAEMICDNSKMLARLHELQGKNLVCYCAPKLCHGHVLEDLCQ